MFTDEENINEFLDEFHNDDGDNDCELPAYVSRPQACKEKPDGYLSQPLHVISAIIVNNCDINSDKSLYRCNCIVLSLIKVRSNSELYRK